MNVSLELMEFEITIFYLKGHRFWPKNVLFSIWPLQLIFFTFYVIDVIYYVFYNLFPALGSGLLLNMTKFEGETDVQVTCEAVGVAPEPRINITIDRFFFNF